MPLGVGDNNEGLVLKEEKGDRSVASLYNPSKPHLDFFCLLTAC